MAAIVPAEPQGTMKLTVTDWRYAWFESHISDRFFQEMARLEKGSVHGLETSAQWMEQIMIEMGTLAQAMIRLEHDGAPEPHVKLAYEKALRLAALCLHLITALAGADRTQLRGAASGDGESAGWAAPQGPPPLPAYPQPGQPRPSAQPEPAPPASEGNGHAPAPEPGMPMLHPLARGPALLQALSAAAKPLAPKPEPEPPPMASPEATDGPIQFNALLQVSGRDQVHSESEMHQTILSLSQQGLSRAEIEVVTGEPRHVIEAVLNHAREAAHQGNPAG